MELPRVNRMSPMSDEWTSPEHSLAYLQMPQFAPGATA
jgi:hypothetical protein